MGTQRTVKKLSGLEIDEVSLVDLPANQHGLVAIAKNHQEDGMGEIFDAQGNQVDEEELEHGDVVYNDNGDELVFVEEGAEDEQDDDGYDDGSDVGKAFGYLRNAAGHGLERAGRRASSSATRAGMQARAVPGRARGAGARGAARGREAGERAGRRARSAGTAAGMQYRAIPEGGRAGIRYGGAAAGGAGAEHERRKHFGKSLGDQVLEDLSKALTDDARDEVIAKAYDYFEDVAKANDRLTDMVEALMEDRELEGYSELAKGYDIPADPNELGGLMYRASQFLPDEDLATLDRLFTSHGEFAKGYQQEIGYNGQGDGSDVIGLVYAAAGEAVGKSAGAITQEQAVTALFDANPAMYDEYLAEQNQR